MNVRGCEGGVCSKYRTGLKKAMSKGKRRIHRTPTDSVCGKRVRNATHYGGRSVKLELHLYGYEVCDAQQCQGSDIERNEHSIIISPNATHMK